MATIGGFKFFRHLDYICADLTAKLHVIIFNITEDMAALCCGSRNTIANEWLQLVASNFLNT
jgi:hypothetical protein